MWHPPVHLSLHWTTSAELRSASDRGCILSVQPSQLAYVHKFVVARVESMLDVAPVKDKRMQDGIKLCILGSRGLLEPIQGLE